MSSKISHQPATLDALFERASEQVVSPNSTDADLARMAGKGDHEAFTEIVRRYHRKLFIFLLHKVHRVEDAEDLLQMVWLQAWKGLGTYKEEGKLKTWLFSIAFHAFLREYNKVRRGLRLIHFEEYLVEPSLTTPEAVLVAPTSNLSEMVEPPLTTPETALVAPTISDLPENEVLLSIKKTNLRLYDAIMQMETSFRDVLILCELLDYSYRGAAEKLDRPRATVKYNLFQARNKLAEILGRPRKKREKKRLLPE